MVVQTHEAAHTERCVRCTSHSAPRRHARRRTRSNARQYAQRRAGGSAHTCARGSAHVHAWRCPRCNARMHAHAEECMHARTRVWQCTPEQAATLPVPHACRMETPPPAHAHCGVHTATHTCAHVCTRTRPQLPCTHCRHTPRWAERAMHGSTRALARTHLCTCARSHACTHTLTDALTLVHSHSHAHTHSRPPPRRDNEQPQRAAERAAPPCTRSRRTLACSLARTRATAPRAPVTGPWWPRRPRRAQALAGPAAQKCPF